MKPRRGSKWANVPDATLVLEGPGDFEAFVYVRPAGAPHRTQRDGRRAEKRAGRRW